MNFQVIIGIICLCYSGVNGGPGSGQLPVGIEALVDTGFTAGVCNCAGGTSSTKIRKPIPFPYFVGIQKGMTSIGPNVLGYHGKDAVQCTVPCSPPKLAKLHVDNSLTSGSSDVPNDERLAVYTTTSSNFCVRRLQFKVKFAKTAWVTITDSAGLGRGECAAWLPNDSNWHWVRCDWCNVGVEQISKLTIKFVQNIKHHVKVKKLQLWNCQ